MSYVNNGDVHYSGIKNEEDIVNALNEELVQKSKFRDFLKSLSNESVTSFVHFGGTGRKDDAGAMHDEKEIIGISIKDHSKKNATLDYVNTSNLEYIFGPNIAHFAKQSLDLIRDKYRLMVPKSFEGKTTEQIKLLNDDLNKFNDNIVPEVRNEVNNLCAEILLKVDSNSIKKIMDKLAEEELPLLAIMNHTEKNRNQIALIKKQDREDIKKYMTYSDNDEYSINLKKNKKGTYKNSSRIYKNGKDTGMRIRCVLNNGIHALLGNPLKGTDAKKNTNRDSILTIKIQNDKVKNWLSDASYIIEK